MSYNFSVLFVFLKKDPVAKRKPLSPWPFSVYILISLSQPGSSAMCHVIFEKAEHLAKLTFTDGDRRKKTVDI